MANGKGYHQKTNFHCLPEFFSTLFWFCGQKIKCGYDISHTHTHTHTSSSSSSSCRAISTDITDTFSPLFPIVHCFWQVFWATSSIFTELLYVCSRWTSCLCSSLWRGLQKYITYELVPTSPAVSCRPGSSNFDSFRDGW